MSPHWLTPDAVLPKSLAIAGAWGYIGRKFLDVALARGIQTTVFDPGPLPADVDPARLTRLDDEDAFYRADADLFHLAMHPAHRKVERLLRRGDPVWILNEKPMAEPDRDAECRRLLDEADRSPAVMLYDFPELFDPLTGRLLDVLGRFRELRVTEIFVQRSKDREDPANPRNRKVMTPIQFQESVHCLAFVLRVLIALDGSLDAALSRRIELTGESEPYVPPNPDAYPTPVDGRCRYHGRFGDIRVEGLTDFKRGAVWEKRRIVRGVGDGRPFTIDVSYLEGKKHFRVDGAAATCDPAADSYGHVLAACARWRSRLNRDEILAGPFPNPRFAYATYRLSSALWESCRRGREVEIERA